MFCSSGDPVCPRFVSTDLYEEVHNSSHSTTFKNLTAQCTSRKFFNPVDILLPTPDTKPPEEHKDKFAVVLKQYIAEPQIYQFCTMVNGSNYLGPIFQRKYHPSNGLLFSRNTLQQYILPHGSKPSGFTPMSVPLRPIVKHHVQINEKVNDKQNGIYIPAWNNSYEAMTLENNYQFSVDNPAPPNVQPRFIVGMIPLRNSDETLLKATWEFIMDFDLTVEVTNGVTGYYGRNTTWSEANYMYPNIQLGSFEKSMVNSFDDRRAMFGVHILKEYSQDKLPVQNKPVTKDGAPIDKSVEGFNVTVQAKDLDHYYP